ncbi:MAG: PDZ domain-containing protein [Candidatus Aminicenantes bacterium]|nr:PDZ domain-containing protein [Candidatus Aminicenantes bacterium]MCJ7487622.1 PDZ domain-containing protein [Candidatus Aminicenantes bacterium]TFG57654.1 MAG: PDZ domain-containing protein [Candidatus Aminicenantes bacterium]
MNRMIKPAFVIMASLAVLAPAFGAETAGAKGIEPNITDVAKKVFPSVVRVEVQNHMRRVATGVVIEKGGYIVTTALISPREGKITITTSEGKNIDAEFLGFDTETQLALLRAKDAGLPALALGKAADLAPGSWVCVVGVSPERTATVTQGIVSSVAEDKLRLNVWVTPGSSGGPVVDADGRMVGLLRGIYMDEKPVVFQFRDREQSGSGVVFSSRAEAPSSGMALAVPVDIVKDISAQIKEKGKVERGWLGVGIGQNEKGQTQIGAIDPDSPAELAKLQAGDIVLKIGDRDVSSPEVLAAEIRKKKPGQDVTLKIDRDGKPLNVKVKLGEMAENEALREMDVRFPGFFGPDAPMPGTAPRAVSPDKAPRPDSPRPLVPMTPEWSYETRKYIGVYCGELNRELAEHFGVKDGTGLIVSKLTEGGPAEKAKLKVGDVITKVDGKRVESANDLIDLVQAKEKGAKIKLEILRDKKAMTIDVEVSEEESSGLFDSGDFQGFLESWQGYTDAFKNELKKWQSEGMPELRQNLKKISPKALLKRI